MFRRKAYGYTARVSGVSVISNVTLASSRDTIACSISRAKPCRPSVTSPWADAARPSRKVPTMGKSTGACLPHQRGSACQRYSRPSSARLVSCAPLESIDADAVLFVMVTTWDISAPSRPMLPPGATKCTRQDCSIGREDAPTGCAGTKRRETNVLCGGSQVAGNVTTSLPALIICNMVVPPFGGYHVGTRRGDPSTCWRPRGAAFKATCPAPRTGPSGGRMT